MVVFVVLITSAQKSRQPVRQVINAAYYSTFCSLAVTVLVVVGADDVLFLFKLFNVNAKQRQCKCKGKDKAKNSKK